MGAPLVFVVAVLALATVFKPVNTDKPPQEVVAPPVISSPQVNTTEITEKLLSLSVPEERVSVAVYELRDKTGQYKDDKLANRKSTAISQGATEMLITALDRSHQFTVLDRVNFKHLLTEQDLRGKKRLAKNNPYPELNKLIGAKYIVGGAITEYNCDVVTGGTKLAVAGVGGKTKFAKATAAIDLRVTDTTTGEVVKTLSMKDKIIGKMVGLNLFSFFKTENLYELESGKGNQEPINLVVRRLIEDMVYQLVESGVFK
ncbi:MAG: CsgG/HfaB family protein [Candidatus Aerophobetes bacterium]|nr:CsgG/HfaB family protein [Candidatus Aerophobetes bacterium]